MHDNDPWKKPLPFVHYQVGLAQTYRWNDSQTNVETAGVCCVDDFLKTEGESLISTPTNLFTLVSLSTSSSSSNI